MSDELITMTATEAVTRLRAKEITPLDLIDAAEARIAEVEPAINALPTLCLDRARDRAKALLAGTQPSATGETGDLAGLPLAIKDLNDVAGVRTTYGSPIFSDHVPAASHPLVERIERKGGIVIAKSNTPEFGAGGSTFNEVFGRTHNPWNTALTPGGSTGGGAAALAAGEIWLAHGTDHGGSLRRPATYCSVVGLRPSPGRVTRGTKDDLFSTLSVQGPMARTVSDVALFLDAMAGFCPLDPLTFDAPSIAFADAVKNPVPPKRVALAPDFAGQIPVDREVREICARAAWRLREAGSIVEEASPDLGNIMDTFLALRSQHFAVNYDELIAEHRDQIKPDIIWNTERGFDQATRDLARAERSRSDLYRRMAAFFETYDCLITAGASTPAFDVNLRMPETIDGRKLEHYLGASAITGAVSVTGHPAIAVPCGFDRFARPVGVQIIGHPRGEARLLQIARCFEDIIALKSTVPIVPRAGVLPPADETINPSRKGPAAI